ncbi:ComEC/Rec2 family competence protein [Persicitalea jodogahamensis]|uniref:MBL fold hydrolase n=1 Tax=Persicitalea jodogahamensis TaxID=402147 RepID=A0A8J3GCG3_9BACT|nr:MBL fold metallo-hydrolase [Persicitalea jodogahamensis]GHB87853.1 MBL fold hydrolase [Persicitalea jodogahamensis]
MTVKIKLFQVLQGDFISIECLDEPKGTATRIFVDAGFVGTYVRTLRSEVVSLKKAQASVDLFVVTHTDNDHIAGIMPLLKEFGNLPVKHFWFNWSPNPVHLSESNGEAGIKEGITLRDYLIEKGKSSEDKILAGQVFDLNNARITVLSPDDRQFDRFAKKWEKEEMKLLEKTGSEASTSQARNDHESIDDLSSRKFIEDKSLSNRSSIAFLLEFEGFKGLFTGDSIPSVIVASLKELGYSHENKLKLDIMKVAHHGSKSNTSRELLQMLDCAHYGVSSNWQNAHNFPHKEALARIVKAREGRSVHFYFNYDDPVLRSIFTSQELDDHNITCHYPAQGENHIQHTWNQ